MKPTSEVAFETAIEAVLLNDGFSKVGSEASGQRLLRSRFARADKSKTSRNCFDKPPRCQERQEG
jgi:hypothetical protein